MAADFDGDGRLDVIGTLASGRISGIAPITITQPLVQFRHVIGPMNPLAAPTGCALEVHGTSVTLSPGTRPGTRNQSGGHTYNVRLSTMPGGGNVLSPSAGANGVPCACRVPATRAGARR